MQAESSYFTNPVIERLTTGRQRLSCEHLTPCLWANGDAIRDRVIAQLTHGIVVHRITSQVAVLHIPFQQALSLQKTADPVGDGIRQSGESSHSL
jgi:hypothetical protein